MTCVSRSRRQLVASDLSRDDLAQISPAAVAALLAENGWTRSRELRASSLWVVEEDNHVSEQLMLPENRAYDDFTTRLSEAIRTLASWMGQTPVSVASRLALAGSDVVRFHADHETPADG